MAALNISGVDGVDATAATRVVFRTSSGTWRRTAGGGCKDKDMGQGHGA